MGVLGKGTTLGYSAVPASTYTLVVGVSDVAFPEITVNPVKDSNYATADGIHGYLAGWKEGGSVSVTKDFGTSDDEDLRGLLGIKKTWKVTYSNGDTDVFVGFVEKIGGSNPNEDKATITFSIKVCTLPVFTQAA